MVVSFDLPSILSWNIYILFGILLATRFDITFFRLFDLNEVGFFDKSKYISLIQMQYQYFETHVILICEISWYMVFETVSSDHWGYPFCNLHAILQVVLKKLTSSPLGIVEYSVLGFAPFSQHWFYGVKLSASWPLRPPQSSRSEAEFLPFSREKTLISYLNLIPFDHLRSHMAITTIYTSKLVYFDYGLFT